MESSIATWTLHEEVPFPRDVDSLLVQGEQAVAAFRTRSNAAIFTTKRLIVRGTQGLPANMLEVYSLVYTAIDMWSWTKSKASDGNSELVMWTNVGIINVRMATGADIPRLDSLLTRAVLQSH